MVDETQQNSLGESAVRFDSENKFALAFHENRSDVSAFGSVYT
jgi:hypothetical protein